MQASNSFKSVFLKKLLVGLQHGDISSKNLSLLERKRAIKLSSDVALAFARDGAIWSHALIRDISKQEKNKTLIRHILGEEFDRMTLKPCDRLIMRKTVRSRKILKKSCMMRRVIRKRPPRRLTLASAIAKWMVKKRTQMLKCIIPGGESMDEFALLDETVDYILSVRAQIDVMGRLANAFEHVNRK